MLLTASGDHLGVDFNGVTTCSMKRHFGRPKSGVSELRKTRFPEGPKHVQKGVLMGRPPITPTIRGIRGGGCRNQDSAPLAKGAIRPRNKGPKPSTDPYTRNVINHSRSHRRHLGRIGIPERCATDSTTVAHRSQIGGTRWCTVMGHSGVRKLAFQTRCFRCSRVISLFRRGRPPITPTIRGIRGGGCRNQDSAPLAKGRSMGRFRGPNP